MLLARISELAEKNEILFNAIKTINKKVNKHIKGEENEKEQQDVINEWLSDERVDNVQKFINKGVK